ncbi:hypothetical protein Sste5346_000065 [Sporothrix stenoceras]|uniref:Extracellular membrane protein CFEM domain-containing protein n=1 Tax=Sporothrix stenoceras TaxID=5173 RepID=A0ABR3ZWK3_9PEZI
MARRRALVFAVALTSMATLASATSSTQVAFTGCLGVCVNHNGCGATNTNCVCSESAKSAFLNNVVSCVANFCLLSNGDNSAATANSVIDAIDSQFLEVVSDVCAADKQSVPASKISAALSSASSLVSEVLGATPTGTTTVTTHATTTVYRSTQTAQAKTTKTVPKAGATSSTSSSTTSTSEETTSEAPATSTTAAAETTTADKKDTTTSTATTKTAATTTTEAPAKDTTDSSPFTNTREDSAAARPFGPAPWTVAAAVAVPLFLSMGLGLL